MSVLEDPVLESNPLTDRAEFQTKEERQLSTGLFIHQAKRIDDQQRHDEYLEDLRYGHFFMAARRSGLIKDF